MEGLTRITADKKKAESILKMVETTVEMIKTIDVGKYSSNVAKEYYDVVRELMTVILLLDGYKTYGEGAHKKLIEYMEMNYKEFTSQELSLINDLRITRNKIAYDGFFVQKEYIERNQGDIQKIINKLKRIINRKL